MDNSSIFDMITSFEETMKELFEGKKENTSDTLSYLAKGERLINTLREKHMKQKKTAFCENEFLNLIDINKFLSLVSTSAKINYLVKRVNDVILRPAARDFSVSEETKEGDYTSFISVVSSIAGIRIDFQSDEEMVRAKSMASQVLPIKLRRELHSVVRLSYTDDDSKGEERVYIPFPASCRISASKNLAGFRFRSDSQRRTYRIGNVDILARAYIICQLHRVYNETIKGIEDGERDYDDVKICRYTKEKLEELVSKHSYCGLLYISDELQENATIKSYCETTGLSYTFAEFREAPVKPLNRSELLIPWLVYGRVSDIGYSIGGYRNDSYLESNFSFYSQSTICDILKILVEEYTDSRLEHTYLDRLSSEVEHARSFENLKNFSSKHLQMMEKSMFNKYFGYIEWDSDMLVYDGEPAFMVAGSNEAETITSHFEAIAKIFKWEKREDVTLRFRKLGNHHASGLYYPYYNCICVDIRTPSSFIHEYFHMLDYKNAHASRSSGFDEVKRIYTSLVRRNVDRSKELKERLKKGTYNLDYYLSPTEIFARTGEIYMTACCHISNVLVKPSALDTFAYPVTDELLSAIRVYFDGFLSFNSVELETQIKNLDCSNETITA